MERLQFLKKHQKMKICAILFLAIFISAEYIHLFKPALGQASVDNFYCDAQYTGQLNGHSMYKADVHEVINFYFNLTDTLEAYVIFGDGTFQINLTGTGSPFSHAYTTEGFYNVTLNVRAATNDTDSDWLIIEIINDPPQFDIGLSRVDYYEGTYTFEDDEIGKKPADWVDANDVSDFYMRNDTPGDIWFDNCFAVSGTYEDLRVEDNVSWVIDYPTNPNHLHHVFFEITHGNGITDGFTPGLYQLYFSANTSVTIYDDYGGSTPIFVGQYCNGLVVELTWRSDIPVARLEIEWFADWWPPRDPPLAIDWFKLVRVDKGVNVVYDTEDHGKIVEMELGNQTTLCEMKNIFTQQQYGTIEFWYKTTDINAGGSFILGETFGVSQKSGNWFIDTNNITPQIDILPFSNEWYHIRFDFREDNTVSYQNLSLGFFRVIINGNASNEFSMGTGGIGVNEFKIETNSSVYIDAVGYSWENYTIGDNFNKISNYFTEQEIYLNVENLLESTVDIEGFNNYEKEIKNNYTYIWDFGDGNISYEKSPMYKYINPGVYPIRLTLIDDQGAITTQVKQISVLNREPSISIARGKNYDTTYDFKYDLNGEPPSDWHTHGDVKVKDYQEGFSKVVEIDNTEGGIGLMSITETICSWGLGREQSIEFWIYFSNVSKDEFYFWTEAIYVFENIVEPWPKSSRKRTGFGLAEGVWKYYGDGSFRNISSLPIPENNEWVHIRLELEESHEKWRLHINDNTSIYYDMIYGSSTINRIVIDTKAYSHIFLDSFGFTSDPNYEIGDNNPKEINKYCGTWDFRHIPDGDIPYDNVLQLSALGPWIFTSNNFGEIADDCSARIISELDGHYKVLELQDNNPNDLIHASLLDFSNPTYGTIEFWLRTNDISQGLVIAFGYEVFDSGIWLGNDGNWWYMNGQEKVRISDVPSMRSDTWHHVRVDFDCRNSGGYLGLGGDQFYFWVDETISNSGQPFNFDHDVSNFKWNIWSSQEEGVDYSIYLDAVGFTWDPAYEIGDNLIPYSPIYMGTEIIFSGQYPETSAYTESLRFFWDFGDNQTARGQTALHTYHTPGQYKIQVTVIDSNGDFDYSEDYVYIENYYPEVSIEKKSYFGNTTYDFDNDLLGICPSGWYTGSFILGAEKAKVIDAVAGFRQVVEIEALKRNVLAHNIRPYHEYHGVSNGTFELWIYTTDVDMTSFGISLGTDGWDYGIGSMINSWTEFSLNYLDTTTPRAFDLNYNWTLLEWVESNTPIIFEDNWQLEPNKWMHLRVDFCADNTSYMGLEEDTYVIYLDDHASQVLPLKDPDFYDVNTVDDITIYGAYEAQEWGDWVFDGMGGKVYLDNIGFSWDENYTAGDNRYSDRPLQFNEGDTLILECDSYDTSLDYTQLIYKWGPPLIDIEELEDMGGLYSHNFIDDDDGDGLEGSSLVCFVTDPYYAWDIYAYPIEINNVLPTLSIHSPSIFANLSIAIYNNGTEGANFSVDILSDNNNRTEIYFPSGFAGNWLNHTLAPLELDLSSNWDILVNQTYREGGQHLFNLKFLFENGQEITTSFNFNGSKENWTIHLNDLWINLANNISRVPITFTTTICDPSNDQIDLVINYIIKSVYEIDYAGAPYTKYYTSIDTPDDVVCELKVYEANGNKYAQVQFIENIENQWDENLRSGYFPVSYDFEFDADMTDIDIDQFTSEILTSENINLLTPDIQRNHFIDAFYSEFNPSCETQNLTIGFNISTDFEFNNVAPSIKIQAPFNTTEDQDFTYQAEIEDFNKDNITVDFYFGINDGEKGQISYDGIHLGNNTYGVNYTYTNVGNYLITVIASDGMTPSKSIHQIKVLNQPPYAKIRIHPNNISEGQPISFDVDISDTKSDINLTRYYWDFGDGYYSTEMSPDHPYANSGNYTVKFTVKDDNGDLFTIEQNVTIFDASPEILGPYSFTAVEGNSFLFDIDVMEGPKDFLMNYTWDIYKANQIFNATYNFMNITDGAIPGAPFEGFEVTQDISYQVINNLSGHVKVLELIDNSNESHGEWRLTYGNNQSINGTIEFWLRTSYLELNKTNFYINLLESGVGVIPIVICDNGTWRYQNIYNGTTSEISNLPIFTSKKWHHIRIDYACSNGSYSGLGENQWRIIVDGVSSPNLDFQLGVAPFNNVSFLDTLQISSANLTKISLYGDAIGYYDGSSQYQIGANTNPTLVSQDYVQTIYGERPSVVFNEGTYLINLTVENELTSNAEFTLDVINIAPVISTSNRYYYGVPGYINLTAYAWDSFVDSDILEFEWFVEGERTRIESATLSSTITVFCNSSGITKGHVIVRDDSDLSSSTEFFIRKFIDTNGDGLTIEQEYMYGLNTSDPDPDGDNLPNMYEILIFGTFFNDPDSDDDGLLDGWDDLTQIGEWFIGTDPTKNDTDDDGLLDSVEFFGWNVSIYIDETLNTFYYSSDPLFPDTDNDGVLDNVEYDYGTNPRDPDTDNDYLSDYKEIYITKTDPLYRDVDEDGLWDGMEVKIGTHFNNPDTDGDGLEDSLEYYGFLGHKTNPLCKDTDHDFLSDAAETIPITTKISGRMSVKEPTVLSFHSDFLTASNANIAFLLAYGETATNISDIKVRISRPDSNLLLFNQDYEMNFTNRYVAEVIDIKDAIEGKGLSYYGGYVLKVTYFDANHSDLCLEEYSLDITRYLNPNNNDFDNDGILDGVETQLLVRGDEVIRYGNLPNITADADPDTIKIYGLEISDLGIMYDAEINFTISSSGPLIGNGSVYVEVIKKELDFRKDDSTLLVENDTFTTNDNFSQDYHIDLSGLFPDNYYGKYEILMDIYDNNNTDVFNLTNVIIKKDGYRIANNSDTEAWITRPDKKDTDDDGWSDKYEIYDRSEPTNPLAWDTDGDGIKDSKDLDPLYDLVLEFEFVEGQIYDLPLWYLMSKNPPHLQMTVSFQHEGTYKAIASPHTKCTQDKKSYKHWFLGIPGTFEVLPRTYYYSTAVFNDRYCIDIADDKNTGFTFLFELWDEGIGNIDQYWDTWLNTKYVQYTTKGQVKDVPMVITDSDWGCYLEAKITLRGLSRANTIAVYENSTIFNGHYNNQDRMHIFQVNLNQTGLGTPFERDTNFILIPNSIFIKTKLNSIIQNSTELANSVLKDGEFISLDRDNLPQESSNIIESFFNITCSRAVALLILDLILTGIINETTEETGIINQYANTKWDGFRAEMMNLHPHVLKVIAIVNPYVSAKMGSLPKTSGEWWADLFKSIGEFLLDIFQEIVNFIVNIVNLLIDIFVALIGLIVKAIILVLVYLTFAITLAVTALTFVAFIPIVSIFCSVNGLSSDITATSFTIYGDKPFSHGYYVSLTYNDFLGLDIPCVVTFYDLNGTRTETELNFFTVLLPTPPAGFYDSLNETTTGIPMGTEEDFYRGASEIMTTYGILMGIAAAGLAIASVTGIMGTLLAVAGIILSCVSLITVLTSLIHREVIEGKVTQQYVYGSLIGGIIVAIFNSLVIKLTGESSTSFADKLDSYGTIEMVLTTIALFGSLEWVDDLTIAGLFEDAPVSAGLFGLVFGMGAMMLDRNSNTNNFAYAFAISAVIIPLIMFVAVCLT